MANAEFSRPSRKKWRAFLQCKDSQMIFSLIYSHTKRQENLWWWSQMILTLITQFLVMSSTPSTLCPHSFFLSLPFLWPPLPKPDFLTSPSHFLFLERSFLIPPPCRNWCFCFFLLLHDLILCFQLRACFVVTGALYVWTSSATAATWERHDTTKRLEVKARKAGRGTWSIYL